MVREPERAESRGFRVVGRVQGVGFRQWTRRTAERLGVSGTVRNLPDGSVEVWATGSNAALHELESALRKGPLAARVDRVESLGRADATPGGEFRVVL